jgi:UDP-N-acetylmuramoylalanine--D-glutamate ligase
MQNLEGKRVLVAGFARSGRAAADFLYRRGAVVTVSDSRPPWSFAAEIPDLLGRKIGVEFGQHGSETFGRQDLVVTSPGVPWELPALQAARGRGIPVVAEVEAASWFFKGNLVGVTGSNGKTTTTVLLGRMLQESGFQTFVGGNIGAPLISMVDESTAESVAVVELSSFQLEGTDSMNPQVAVMLNITPNHLDRHPSFESYVEAKARIFSNQTESDYAVLNADDPVVAGLAERGHGRKTFFSRTQDIPEGLLLSGGQVVYRVGHLQRDLFSPGDVKLRGAFNLENVLAASAAASVLGADFDAIAKAVREFRGVEHRLELAGEVLGVEFYNDSKATSVDATVKALGAFDGGVHLILGGKDKGAPYAPLIPLLKNRVREVLLIGAAAERIGGELAGTADLVPAGDLETAVRRAFSRARPDDVILLSPACSSFDQFQDYEERGRRFKQIVEGLAQEGHVARLRRTWLGDSRARRTQPEAGSGRGATTLESVPEPFQLSPPATAPPATGPAQWGTAKPPAVIPSLPSPSVPATAELPTGLPEPLLEDEISEAAEAEAKSPERSAPAEVPPLLVPASAAEETLPYEEPAAPEPAPGPPESAPGPPVSARGPEPERLKTPEPPAAEPDQTSPDRIYVYELDSEQRPPMDADEPFSDIVLDRGNAYNLDLDLKPTPTGGDMQGPRDEPLIFEVTPEAPSAGGSRIDSTKPGDATSQAGLIAGSGEEAAHGKRRRKKAPGTETSQD